MPEHVKQFSALSYIIPKRIDRPNSDNIVLLAGEPERPKWMTGKNRAKWDEKVATFRSRGITVRGYEDQLAIYVATLVKMETDLESGREIQASTLAQLRQMAREFFDTPQSAGRLSRKKPTQPSADGNPFAQRGIANKPP